MPVNPEPVAPVTPDAPVAPVGLHLKAMYSLGSTWRTHRRSHSRYIRAAIKGNDLAGWVCWSYCRVKRNRTIETDAQLRSHL